MLTLAITGFEAAPDSVTATLGVEPTHIGRKGEPSQSGRPQAFNGWWHDVEPQRLLDGKQHEDALKRLLALLRGREDRFARLRETVQPRQITIYGGLYVDDERQCGVWLDSEQMKLLSACGVGWGLDLFADEPRLLPTSHSREAAVPHSTNPGYPPREPAPARGTDG